MSNSLEHLEHQAPQSMEFFRQEYWSGLPCPSPRDLPDQETEPRSPALQQILYLLSHRDLYLNVFFVPIAMLKPLQFSPRHALLLFPPYPHPSVPKLNVCCQVHLICHLNMTWILAASTCLKILFLLWRLFPPP